MQEERKGCLPRTLLTAVILLLVVLTTLFFAVRTDGARVFIQGWLEKRLGVELIVGKARIDFPYVLVLEDVKTVGFKMDQTAGFHAQEVRIAPAWRPMLSVTVVRGTCCLAPAKGNGWEPTAVSFLGHVDFELPPTAVAATRELRDKLRIRLEDGAFCWLAPGGSGVQRTAAGVFFALGPMRASDRCLYHYRLRVRSQQRTGARPTKDLQREWVATDEKDYVELSRSVPVAKGSEQQSVTSDQ